VKAPDTRSSLVLLLRSKTKVRLDYYNVFPHLQEFSFLLLRSLFPPNFFLPETKRESYDKYELSGFIKKCFALDCKS
jgi:hypothetical protein